MNKRIFDEPPGTSVVHTLILQTYKPGFLLLFAVLKALTPFLVFKTWSETRVYCSKHFRKERFCGLKHD